MKPEDLAKERKASEKRRRKREAANRAPTHQELVAMIEADPTRPR